MKTIYIDVCRISSLAQCYVKSKKTHRVSKGSLYLLCLFFFIFLLFSSIKYHEEHKRVNFYKKRFFKDTTRWSRQFWAWNIFTRVSEGKKKRINAFSEEIKYMGYTFFFKFYPWKNLLFKKTICALNFENPVLEVLSRLTLKVKGFKPERLLRYLLI